MQVVSSLIQYKNSSKNMHAPSSIKQEFLKKWTLGLQACSSAKKNMSVLERKKAIKLSADIAMACTRNDDRTCWSRALIANASKNCDQKALLEHILAHDHRQKNIVSTGPLVCGKRITSKKILKRSRRRIPRVRSGTMVLAKSIAKRMLKKRTQVLKGLLPGGEFMDDVSLIRETLDYIMSLRVQVDVMRTIANGSDLLANGN
uniref:IBH1-like N-terminal domain-containing protein n=1 Tax=Rhizophora mucronata TaxID=61149 RepID=A0A2P2J9A8_RHIMU